VKPARGGGLPLARAGVECPSRDPRRQTTRARGPPGRSARRGLRARARRVARAADATRCDLLARHTRAEPPLVDLEALAEVAERVAGDHRTPAPDPEHSVVLLVPGEHIGAERQLVAGRIRACLAFLLAEQPDEVGTALAGLLGGDAVHVHEVLRGVGQRRVDRHAEPLDQALRVALVPGRGEHDRRLAAGRAVHELARHGQRIEEQEALPVVASAVGGDRAVERERVVLRDRCLPVPKARTQLAHGTMLLKRRAPRCLRPSTPLSGDAGVTVERRNSYPGQCSGARTSKMRVLSSTKDFEGSGQ
jgi:hypothetical protein